MKAHIFAVTARFLVLDGHRRLVAMDRLGMQHARVWVLTTLSGAPLNPVERLAQWLLSAANTKKPTTQQTILAIVRLRLAWVHVYGDSGRTRRFPSQRAIAQRLRVSLGTVSQAMRIARQPDLFMRAITSGALQVTAAQVILNRVPDEEQRVQFVLDVLRENEQRGQAGRARLTVDEIHTLCRTRRHPSSAGALGQVVTPAPQAERAMSPRLQAPEVARREVASRTTLGRHVTASNEATIDTRGRFSGLHIVNLPNEDPAPDAVQVFAALALDVVDWHGKVQTYRDAHLPKVVRAPCAALSDQRVVGLLQSLLAAT
jgi:hypothetical protein